MVEPLYDKKVHLGQQMENYLNAFASGDSTSLERILSNMKDIINDGSFKTDLEGYEKARQKSMTEAMKNATENAKKLVEAKNIGEILVVVEELKNGLQAELDIIEGKHWEKIRSYLLGTIDRGFNA